MGQPAEGTCPGGGVGGASATRGRGCGLWGAVAFCARGGGNDWWPLNRKWLAARGLSGGTGWHCSVSLQDVVGGAKRRLRGEGRRYRMEVEGGVGPRIARRACTGWRAGRALRSERRAAPRLAFSGPSGVALTAQGRLQSWGPARGRPQPGVLGVRLARSGGPPRGRDFAHSPTATLPVPLARPSVGSALHPRMACGAPPVEPTRSG